MPLAGIVGQMQAQEMLWPRALGTHAPMPLAGDARLPQVVCDQGLVEGTTRWWLAQRERTCVVPAQAPRAVTTEARAQATAGEEMTVGRRAHTVRQGQGNTAHTARLATEVVGSAGRTTSEQ